MQGYVHMQFLILLGFISARYPRGIYALSFWMYKTTFLLSSQVLLLADVITTSFCGEITTFFIESHLKVAMCFDKMIFFQVT